MDIHTDDVAARKATNGDSFKEGGGTVVTGSEVRQNQVSAVGESGTGERDGYADEEIVILVVAHKTKDKSHLVDAIKGGDLGSWGEERPVGSLRIHSRLQPPRKILEPTRLDNVSGKSPTAIARKWISKNSLRRVIVNKRVIVVCVITLSILGAPCFSSVFGYDNCWVDVLSILFRSQKGGILFVVKHDKELDNSETKKIRTFIRNHNFNSKNIIFSGFGEEVRKVLEQNIGLAASCSSIMPEPLIKISPFFQKERSSQRKKYTAWSPERVMLFGRAGSGKSTLAQMLTTRRLDPLSKVFSFSSSLRGHTKGIDRGEGRGWYVVDTPGFGEPSEGGTVSTEEVQRKVKKFVDLVDGTFAHYLFVVQSGRVDQLEVNLWQFFKLLFGEEICDNFSIVFSGADEDWLRENLGHLQRSFEGCSSFVCANFPTTREEDEENEEMYQELQIENEEFQRASLERLEEELAKLGRCDRGCDYGKGSRTSKAIERDRANSDMNVEKSLRTRMIVEGSEILFGVDELLSGLIHRLTVNDRIVLVPLTL